MEAPTRLGEYELLFELARGGMATLHVARQVGVAKVERLVAVKRMHHHILAEPGILPMFRDEARLAALIRHPNVVRVLDVAEVDDELLIVLDYVESLSLSALRRAARDAGDTLPIPVVVRILADALTGLHAAHEATDLRGEPLGIVHRDFSPQNVLVGVDGTSQLIDFGVAKANVRDAGTESGVLKGKYQYMSPEQARGTSLDRRSDIFSAGVVLFEALTGSLPFGDDAHDPSAILLRIVLDPVAPPSDLVKGISPELDAVVERAFERVRDERYQTAAEMCDALVAAVPPASHAEVRELIERYGGTMRAERRTKVQSALRAVPLAQEASTLPATPPARNAATPPSSTEPREITTAHERAVVVTSPPPRAPATLARVAAVAGAVTAVVAVLTAGVLLGVAWRDRRPPPDGAATTTAAQTPTVTSNSTPEAIGSAPVPVDAAPALANEPSSPATSVTSGWPAPPAPSAAPTQPITAASEIAPPKLTGFAADGSLVVGGFRIRARPRIVNNTTGISNGALQQGLTRMSSSMLVGYRDLPPTGMPPSGTVTETMVVDDGRFGAGTGPSSTIANPRLRGPVAQGLLNAFLSASQSEHKPVSGTVTLAADITVAPVSDGFSAVF